MVSKAGGATCAQGHTASPSLVPEVSQAMTECGTWGQKTSSWVGEAGISWALCLV